MERQDGRRHPLPGPCAPSSTDPGRTTMTASKTTGCSRRSRLALAIGAAVALSTAGTALAQDAEGSPAPAAASTAAGAPDLDAVLVTANTPVERPEERRVGKEGGSTGK